MEYRQEMIEEKNIYGERFALAAQRIKEIYQETAAQDAAVTVHGEAYGCYFHTVSGFLLEIHDFYQKKLQGVYTDASIAELQQLNTALYRDVTGENYRQSFANPDFAAEKLGKEFAPLLCTLYTELRSNIVYAFEDRLFYLTTLYELFIEIYNLLEQKDAMAEEVRSAIYYYFFDYADINIEDSLRELFDPERNFATDIICGCDLKDLRYLYYFGEYITENELQTAAYFNSLPEQDIRAMASTLTEGFRRGYELYRIDMSEKRTVNIRYHLGFERMIREVISQFKAMGLKPCIYRSGISIRQRNLRGKTGYFGASPNKQYEYDHRMDNALFFDKAYTDRVYQEQKQGLEKLKKYCDAYAGPVLIETFGELPFNPQEKKTAFHYSEKQQRLKLAHQSAMGLLQNEYIPGDKTSFSIIAYPLPEIGKQYHDIFRDTIRVNTLDQKCYLEIQTKIINALDAGERVTITGRNGNRTNLTVALTPLSNPEKQTKFENCLADVNIPLGEVFTSPQLKETQGILHVSKVFLNELEYHNLELTFQDGVITQYSCDNFETEAENKKYIKENVLFHHDTLPMGEFAIGTNTAAYVMGKKYEISHLLPILIAEKTGPHFAVGDTCFSHEEELATFNPDGKQMIAKENDFSRLRDTDSEKAYFNCHTDITIPYDELGDIIVHKADGTQLPIICDGRFVLPGTELLNQELRNVKN
ncbi:MAG: aminopeptidase [Clostridiaceae bacterium]|nr:aminopeptidase [Clostridiaceae bacterium]